MAGTKSNYLIFGLPTYRNQLDLLHERHLVRLLAVGRRGRPAGATLRFDVVDVHRLGALFVARSDVSGAFGSLKRSLLPRGHNPRPRVHHFDAVDGRRGSEHKEVAARSE